MRQRLLALPFPAFALTVSQLLRCLGYEGVTLRGVTGKKGRNSYGGLDIEATLLKGLTRSRVICQLRQYDTQPVPRQSVDVLRGTMLRMGADQGLLVTTSGFSPAAIEAAQAAQHAAPVRLIDDCELAMLLLRHNILPEQGSENEGSAANPIKDAVAPAYPAAEVVKEKPPVRAVPTAASTPTRSNTPGAVQEDSAQGKGQPPVATTTTLPLSSPTSTRRGIAITIVLSPMANVGNESSGSKSESNEARS